MPVIGRRRRLFTEVATSDGSASADRPFVVDGRRDRPARDLLQRGPRQRKSRPNGNHRQAFTTARVPPQASQSVSRGPTDAQHARGLLDRQEVGKLRRRPAQGGSPGWLLPPRPRTSPPRPRKRMDVVTRWWFHGQRVAAAAGLTDPWIQGIRYLSDGSGANETSPAGTPEAPRYATDRYSIGGRKTGRTSMSPTRRRQLGAIDRLPSGRWRVRIVDPANGRA